MILRNQRGAVLVTVMIYMLVLAMIGISSMRATPKNAQSGDGFLDITNTYVKAWDSNNNGSLTDAERSWSQH